jgi:hypothetical protein
MPFPSVCETQMAGGAGFCTGAAHVAAPNADCANEGAHGGTMGSPVLNREDALIMWRDPVREPASA